MITSLPIHSFILAAYLGKILNSFPYLKPNHEICHIPVIPISKICPKYISFAPALLLVHLLKPPIFVYYLAVSFLLLLLKSTGHSLCCSDFKKWESKCMTLLCKTFLVLRMKSKLLIMACSALYDERFDTPVSLFSLTAPQPHWPVLVPQTLQTCFYLSVF